MNKQHLQMRRGILQGKAWKTIAIGTPVGCHQKHTDQQTSHMRQQQTWAPQMTTQGVGKKKLLSVSGFLNIFGNYFTMLVSCGLPH